MSRAPVYLDYHATTPVDPRVLERMMPFFTADFGNAASSTHQWGWKAQAAVETARKEIAAIVGSSAREVVFTSGATESNNLAIQGIARRAPASRRQVVISSIEHKSVLEAAHLLEGEGWTVDLAPVGRDGRVDLDALNRLVSDRTALVSVMAANNEIGVVQSLTPIGALARSRGAVFHVDAAQAVGKVPIDVGAMQIDLLALTAHKIYGPKGIGALVVRKGLDLAPLLVGGGHERGLRAGTLNVPGIVGLGAACALCRTEMAIEMPRLARLRDRLLAGLESRVGGVVVNGSREHRLSNNLHVTFDDVDGEELMIGIGDIAVSTGSACSSASAIPSHVLQAIMHPDPVPAACIRFGLGRFTTEDEVDYAVEKFAAVVGHLRRKA